MRIPGRPWITGASLAALVALGAVTAAPAAASPPKIFQVSYFEAPGEGPNRGLEAFARHTHAVRFATSFHGRSAHAPGRYIDTITDTDIRGHQAKHPWKPDRRDGGRRVIRFVHRSLHERGFAVLRLRARKDGAVDRARVRIDLSECSSDPPLYPVDCEVRV